MDWQRICLRRAVGYIIRAGSKESPTMLKRTTLHIAEVEAELATPLTAETLMWTQLEVSFEPTNLRFVPKPFMPDLSGSRNAF